MECPVGQACSVTNRQMAAATAKGPLHGSLHRCTPMCASPGMHGLRLHANRYLLHLPTLPT